jgi:hypothetical protein
MVFIELREFRAVEVIERKERVSLIVKISMDSHVVFFRDKTFQHIDRATNSVFYEGKL